ncbi:BTB/POZ domain-containing protein KCTD12-like isoform X2 [Hyperolius riggenbachi]|uniref:BTB/POZ domain-containing protein KCTD12-like isoform X2 n=1 Tax=Hyperolius riggenbachi TaxID=752182 RepID=UPI0035A274E2
MALPDNLSCIKREDEMSPFPDIIELNVGGQVYITRYPTLVSIPGSLLWEMFSQRNVHLLARDSRGRYFLDRDGFLFRYVLDFMRDQQLVLPEHFPERNRLQREAEYFKLPELVKILAPNLSKQNSVGDDVFQSDSEEQSPNVEVAKNQSYICSAFAPAAGNLSTIPNLYHSGFITIGYRGSYTLGRDSQTDAKFRRVARIMVCGKTSLAKEVFGDTLNESRDPDRPPERYTSRYYLKFTFLEQAFDKLADAGFNMVACNSTGTCSFTHDQTDDKIWTSYTEYIFYHKKFGEEINQLIPPLPFLENQDQNSSNEISSSSLDSHDSATPSTVLPPGETTLMTDLYPSMPEENSPCPTTIHFQETFIKNNQVKSLEFQKVGTEEAEENGMGQSPQPPQPSEEKKALEIELVKCIEEFRKIKIPVIFPNKKRHWQNELLRKYQL